MSLAWLLVAGAALAAYDVNEVPLGASEQEVRQRFPHANCRPIEWKTEAADRRCDDSRVHVGGIDAGVTFYLRKDSVEGFDVRFHTGDWQRVAAHLRTRFGAPRRSRRSLATRCQSPVWKRTSKPSTASLRR